MSPCRELANCTSVPAYYVSRRIVWLWFGVKSKCSKKLEVRILREAARLENSLQIFDVREDSLGPNTGPLHIFPCRHPREQQSRTHLGGEAALDVGFEVVADDEECNGPQFSDHLLS